MFFKLKTNRTVRLAAGGIVSLITIYQRYILGQVKDFNVSNFNVLKISLPSYIENKIRYKQQRLHNCYNSETIHG